MTGSLSESLGGGSPLAWASDFLALIHKPETGENLRVIVAWEEAESGGGGGMWNPLNTTEPGYGGTDANSAHVKNYPSRANGLAANAVVINNGLYGPILAALARGDNAYVTVGAIVTSPWGTRRINLGGPIPTPGPLPVPKPPVRRTMPMIVGNGHGGYWIVHADGAVYAFGGAVYHGGANVPRGDRTPIVDAASSPTGGGYWLLSAAGNVYAYGDAKFAGGAPVVT